MNKAQGISIILLSVLCYASLPPLIKKASLTLPPFATIAVSMFVLFISSLFLSIFTEHSISPKLFDNKGTIAILVLVGLINTLGFWLAIKGYAYMPLWQQTMFQLLTPLLAGIFAYFLLGEALSSRLFIGLLVMGMGLFIALR